MRKNKNFKISDEWPESNTSTDDATEKYMDNS
jgi:hypothetical protein